MTKTANTSSLVKGIFGNKRNIVIIGLCGKKGSGCSTAAKVLSMGCEELLLDCRSDFYVNNNFFNQMEYEIICKYAKKNWQSFDIVKTDVLITASMLKFCPEKFSEFFCNIPQEKKVSFAECESVCKQFFDRRLYINLPFLFDETLEFSEKNFLGLKGIMGKHSRCCPLNEEAFTESIIYSDIGIELKTASGTSWVSISNKQLYSLFIYYREHKHDGNFHLKPAFIYMLVQYIFYDLPIWCDEFWGCLKDISGKCDISFSALQLMEIHMCLFGEPFYQNLMKPSVKGYIAVAEDIDAAVTVLYHYHTFFYKAKFLPQCTLVAIDSINNYFESQYFADRYSGYFLLGLFTEELKRKNRLMRINFDEKDFWMISAVEQQAGYRVYSQKYRYFVDRNQSAEKVLEEGSAYSYIIQKVQDYIQVFDNDLKDSRYNLEKQIPYTLQDISTCLEKADILVDNSQDDENIFYLKFIILRYVCLMMHPGLVLPTPIERNMQIAYTAKLNSGCISRQVGAVITDSAYQMLSMGWNHQNEEELPCLYCDISERKDIIDDDCSKELKSIVQNCFTGSELDEQGIWFRYCFKDLYNYLSGEKNPGHTRAVHAEEDAFQNLGVNYRKAQGGYLFTTTSPCKQCYKKAVENSIAKIYYIELYPDTPLNEEITVDKNQDLPELVLATGAIGQAYVRLYTPILVAKKEDELWLGSKLEEMLDCCKC